MKVYIKCIYLTAIVFLLANPVFGQMIFSPFSGLLNNEIYTTDSVFYRYGIFAGSSGCKVVNKTIETRNDSIFLNTCIHQGILAHPCDVFDTLLIAQNLSKGDYILVHYSHLGSFHIPEDTLCQLFSSAPTNHDTAYYSFTVLATTATGEPVVSAFNIYPNPFSDNILVETNFERSPSSDVRVSIISINGEILFNGRMDKYPFEVNTRFLRPGIYAIRLIVDGELQAVKKIVKIE